MRVRLLMTVTIAAVVAACSEVPAPVAGPSGPTADIVDGGHGGGNPFFHFLPPLVAGAPSGVNVGGLSPVVDVCVWNGANCTAPIAHYTTDPTNTTTTQAGNSETVRASNDGYIVNWHAHDFDLVVGQIYRICVSAGSQRFGHADVSVVGTGGALKDVNSNQFIGLVDGRTLPIKFRIEDGALDEETDFRCMGPGDPE